MASNVLTQDPGPEAAGIVNPAAGAAPTAAPAPAATPVVEGPVCEKCATPLDPKKKSGWCLRCGYYPQLKTFVELDPWDKEVPAEEQAEAEEEKPVWKFIPAWAWLLILGCVVLFAVSLLVRFLTPADSSFRTGWAVGQLGTGFLVFLIAHVGCYMFAIMQNDRLNILDILLKPLAIWGYTVKDLPHSFRRVAAGTWGLWATLMAFAIGGIDYNSLVDWGSPQKAKKTLVQAITQAAAKQKGEDKGLGDAVQDFAGKAGVDDLKKKKDKPIERRQNVECLIIGFMPLGEDDFSSLLLAASVNNQLRFVGPVTDGIPAEVRQKLKVRMNELKRPTPIVKSTLPGVWLEPALVCRVKFEKWSGNHRLQKPLFDALLAELEEN